MLWLKALHIIFVVCWFAGIFYLPRIFVQARDGAGGAQEEIEIGSFLGREDTRQLETDLRRMVHAFT